MILTRPAVAEDRDFIVSGWSTSYRSSADETRPMSMYARQMHEEVECYLSLASTIVAHGELGVLMGFMTYDPTTYVTRGRYPTTLDGYVIYVYVAGPFRRHGVARKLFAAAGISPYQRFGYTYRTQWTRELRSKFPNARHETCRARYEEIEHVRREASTEAGAHADPGHKDLAP